VRGGLLIRTAISAAPFLLPLMFQLAFGLDPLASGLLLLAVFAGNLGMKPATSAVLKTFGFRRTLLVNGGLAMATIMACGLMTPDTPKVLIVAVLFVSGLSRSMQFTTVNALSFSELSQERMSGANTLFSMMQQVGNALGVAIGAIALRLAGFAHPDSTGVTVGDFHIAFFAVGLVGLLGVIEFRRLPVHAGAVLRERPTPEKPR
jgi:MFS family permease